MKAFGSNRITRTQASLLFALAYEAQQILWHSLAQPVDSGLRMLPGTSHCKGHVYHPCVPIG